MNYSICVSTAFFLFWVSFLAQAQQDNYVRGRLVSAEMLIPIEGASVFNKTKQHATLADHTGRFFLRADPGDSLLIRSVGYRSKVLVVDLEISAGKPVTIIMEEDSVKLPEVEITALPTLEQLKRNLGNRAGRQSNVRNPAYIPPATPTGSPASSVNIGSPIGALYNLLSSEGKQLRQLEELEAKQKKEQERKERERYNSFFKDNTGYEY